jgi:S-adenosylmethionine hydrolase
MVSKIEKPNLVALFTDFGVNGPYHGQMQVVLAAAEIEQPVVQLLADAPRFAPKLSAYLLAALADDLPAGYW